VRAQSIQQGCDRRILKAFYTQYVAVLLILLVFCVGAFQRADTQAVAVTASSPVKVASIPVGVISLGEISEVEGETKGRAQLEAVASLIREHDVEATIVFSVAKVVSNADVSEVDEALERVGIIERFFAAQDIPLNAVRFIIRENEEKKGTATIELVEVARDKLHL
jgi:hypothetical protein